MPYRQGDTVLVSFPFTDLSSSKRRPALVLSPDSFNAAGEDLVLAAVTSQITDDPNAVPLWQGHFAEGGLPKPQYPPGPPIGGHPNPRRHLPVRQPSRTLSMVP
ncbi:MAG: type II toxin-antitoxin system PemK/MazF family toxin [Gemmatimonadetes bacterium]|nr:type II toxin-antitoxin system PemK/MazF family toxin [Gemmatimonadota bacterium]MYH51499.1 type II toxin-antitoxin system PemK/MazF family toxin [Gemmatimonadota bacterium]MYK66240.1 type II toxin-antitoxin system PemK/MazF family toxin [Gemmatimonadota bacterium]